MVQSQLGVKAWGHPRGAFTTMNLPFSLSSLSSAYGGYKKKAIVFDDISPFLNNNLNDCRTSDLTQCSFAFHDVKSDELSMYLNNQYVCHPLFGRPCDA
jgi:hypothetical protein